MSWADNKRIAKGILFLSIFILFGVIAAELQINQLTEYHDFVQAFNVRYNAERNYSVYFLGYQYILHTPYTFAEVMQRLKEKQQQVFLASKEYSAYRGAADWFAAVRKACIEKAFQGKKWMEDEWRNFLFQMEHY
jgi:hypothetical protein